MAGEIQSFVWKWLTVPFTNNTKRVQSAQLWEVRWQSRHGEYHSDTRPELEAFPSLEAAEAFAVALRNAFRLVRHSSGTRVVVKPAESR